jgi:Tol biopolymer transport system component
MRCIVYLIIWLFSIVCYQVAAQLNERILFAHEGDIWVMNPDGSDPVNLTNTPDEMESIPDISADGNTIVYIGPEGATFREPGSVWVMNADGTNRRELEATRNAELNDSPTLSPDGRRILYRRFRLQFEEFDSTLSAFAVINTDGTDLHFLKVPGRPLWFSWSSTVDKIVFSDRSETALLDL